MSSLPSDCTSVPRRGSRNEHSSRTHIVYREFRDLITELCRRLGVGPYRLRHPIVHKNRRKAPWGGTNWADAPENAQLALFDALPNCKLEVRYKILSATGILGFVGISLFCRTFSKVGPVSRTTLVAGLRPDTLGGKFAVLRR